MTTNRDPFLEYVKATGSQAPRRASPEPVEGAITVSELKIGIVECDAIGCRVTAVYRVEGLGHVGALCIPHAAELKAALEKAS